MFLKTSRPILRQSAQKMRQGRLSGWMMRLWCFWMLIIGIILFAASWAKAAVRCNDTHNPCEELLLRSSQCRDGFCTNPFRARGGCLRSLLASEEYGDKYTGNSDETSPALAALRRRFLDRPRVCNSEDGAADVARGICVENANEYPEVRLYSQNWESAFALSWIMQIIYSELLGVPSTIETGIADKKINFYDETNRMDYGSSNDFALLQNAHDAGGDCTSSSINHAAENYKGCAHAIMEVWPQGKSWVEDAQKKRVIESPSPNGISGYQGWYITRSSVEREPSLGNYFGLSGEDNRKKLADIFKRPTTWSHYCSLVSSTNCTVADDVARRPPADDGSEDGRYFYSGSYTGYFRFTDENNCTLNENCTGHFLDYPCGWTSFVKQQTHHLNIALESSGNEDSGGYTYDEMKDIWTAANATKSDVIGLWWKPDATASLFKGSESDLILVTLPVTTQECIDNRIDIKKRCDPTATKFDLYGDERGACGEHSDSLAKVAVVNFKRNIVINPNKRARMSPAYSVYKEFSISQIEVEEILSKWINRGKDKQNFDLRHATCEWVAENIEHIVESFIPQSHPRIFVASKSVPVTVVACAFSAVAIMLTVGTAGAIICQKDTISKEAQIEFLMTLLAGLLLANLGSFLLALEPSKGTCIASTWMIAVGISMQLVPMIIRVSAIINVVRASRRMKRVKVRTRNLLIKSLGIGVIMALYCMFWTIFDPPKSQESMQITDKKNEFGESVVKVSNLCDCRSKIWFLLYFVSEAVLLLCGSVLAYQMKSLPSLAMFSVRQKSLDDSTYLSRMIYASFLLLVLRSVIYVVVNGGTFGVDTFQKISSIFISVNSMASILIFYPRFFFKKAQEKKKELPRMGSPLYYAQQIARRLTVESPIARITRHLTVESPTGDTNERPSLLSYPRQIYRRLTVESSLEDDDDNLTIIKLRLGEESLEFPQWVVEEYGTKVKSDTEQQLLNPLLLGNEQGESARPPARDSLHCQDGRRDLADSEEEDEQGAGLETGAHDNDQSASTHVAQGKLFRIAELSQKIEDMATTEEAKRILQATFAPMKERGIE